MIPDAEVDAQRADVSTLFGRRLVFAFIAALQLLGATLVSPVLAHLLGPDSFGALATAIALYQVLIVLATLGLDQAIVLQRAEDDDGAKARGLLAVSLVFAAFVALLAGITGPLWSQFVGFPGFTSLLVMTVLWVGPGAAVQAALSLLSTEDRLKAFTAVSLISTLGGPFLGLAFLLSIRVDEALYAFGGVVSQGLALLLALLFARPRLRGLVDLEPIRKAMVIGLPLAFSQLSVFVLNTGDRIIVQRELGTAEVGRYQIAYTVGNAVLLLVSYVGTAWTPSLATAAPSERRAITTRSRDELLLVLSPVVVGMTLASPVALRLVSTPEYRPETLLTVTLLVMLSAFPVAVAGSTGRLLFTLRRTRPMALVTLVAAVVNVILNVLLVPSYGIEGSAAATLFAFTLQAVLLSLALRSNGSLPRPSLTTMAVVAGSVLVACLSVVPDQTPTLNAVRFGLGLLCLPWLLVRVRSARR